MSLFPARAFSLAHSKVYNPLDAIPRAMGRYKVRSHVRAEILKDTVQNAYKDFKNWNTTDKVAFTAMVVLTAVAATSLAGFVFGATVALLGASTALIGFSPLIATASAVALYFSAGALGYCESANRYLARDFGCSNTEYNTQFLLRQLPQCPRGMLYDID